jgi:hypothetical protein
LTAQRPAGLQVVRPWPARNAAGDNGPNSRVRRRPCWLRAESRPVRIRALRTPITLIAHRLQQCLTALVDNALLYSDGPAPTAAVASANP